jgi:hypothetical protein
MRRRTRSVSPSGRVLRSRVAVGELQPLGQDPGQEHSFTSDVEVQNGTAPVGGHGPLPLDVTVEAPLVVEGRWEPERNKTGEIAVNQAVFYNGSAVAEN